MKKILVCKAVESFDTTKELMAYFKAQNEPCYIIAVDVDIDGDKDTEIVAELKVRESK